MLCVFHGNLSSLMKQSVESLVAGRSTLEMLSSQLKEVKAGRNQSRKYFLDFVHCCWNHVPDDVNKDDPNRTCWPLDLSSNKFFREFADIICGQLYEVPAKEGYKTLADLVLIAQPHLSIDEAAKVKASCDFVDVLTPEGEVDVH